MAQKKVETKVYKSIYKQYIITYPMPNGETGCLTMDNGTLITENPEHIRAIEKMIAAEEARGGEKTILSQEQWDATYTPDKVIMEGLDIGGETSEALHKKQIEEAVKFALEKGFKIPEVKIFDKKFRGGLTTGVTQAQIN